MNVTAVSSGQTAENRRPLDHRKLGMWLFIGSEVMFFAGFLSAFVHFKARNPGATDILDVPLTTLNSFLLLTSSFTVVSALSAIRRNDVRTMWDYLVATWLLGAGFLMGQALEFSKLTYEGVTLDTIFGSTFYSVTGLHGLHVLVGLLWLMVLLVRTYRRSIRGEEHGIQIEVFGLYWHFVDVVWIFLFAIIYLVR